MGHTISILKKEVEKIYKLVEVSREKEDKAKSTIQQLKNEIAHLGRIVEQGSGLSIGQDNTVNELLRVKDELTKYRDLQNSTIIQLRAESTSYYEKIQKMENEKISTEAEIQNLRDQINQSKQEADREERRKQRMESEMASYKTNLQKSRDEVNDKEEKITNYKNEAGELQNNIKELELQNIKKAEDINDA